MSAPTEHELPATVRQIVIRWYGDRGRAWLDALPAAVTALAERWDAEFTGPPLPGGTQSYVAPVRLADGSDAVLKMPILDDENLAEATALHHYGGDGAVRLFAYDAGTGAMLLERALPGAPLLDLADRAHAIDLGCAVLRKLWRVPGATPAGYPEPRRVTDLAAHWAEWLPEHHARPGGEVVPKRLVRHAAELAAAYSVADGPQGIVNQDTHLGNVISAEREPWLLIDPKPLLGERAFDAGFLVVKQLVERPTEEDARETVARIADGLGAAPERVRDWALIRAVSNVVWLAVDHGEDLNGLLTTADVLAEG